MSFCQLVPAASKSLTIYSNNYILAGILANTIYTRNNSEKLLLYKPTKSRKQLYVLQISGSNDIETSIVNGS